MRGAARSGLLRTTTCAQSSLPARGTVSARIVSPFGAACAPPAKGRSASARTATELASNRRRLDDADDTDPPRRAGAGLAGDPQLDDSGPGRLHGDHDPAQPIRDTALQDARALSNDAHVRHALT